MKSSVHIKGHPVHPILVAFPIAFFTGTLLFDVLGLVNGNSGLWLTATYLEIAGIISGLIAAVSGAIDYFSVVPPRSSAKTRAAKHGLINVCMVGLFIVAFCLRMRPNISLYLVTGIELTSFILMAIAGWLGGTLVYRNQIGVYNRYASSGKWNEARIIANDNGRVEVAKANELKTDQMKLLHIGDKRIVLARTEDKYVAFDDRCTHKGASLAGGVMVCGTVQCPWHGSQFSCLTGEVKASPARKGIETYTVSEEQGKVYITL